MTTLAIVLEGDPILRRTAEPVTEITGELRRLIRDMFDTMYHAQEGGVGLAAPQVGVSRRIIVADVGDDPIAIINPVCVEATGEETALEGCLSIPGKAGYVTRSAEVLVTGLSPKGEPVQLSARGFLARVLQHELDHLDGILYTDKATGVHGGE